MQIPSFAAYCLLANGAAGIALVEYALYHTKKIREEASEERDGAYPEFRRLDLKCWNRRHMYPKSFFLPIKFFTSWMMFMTCGIIVILLTLGRDLKKPLPSFLEKLIQKLVRFTVKAIFMLVNIHVKYEYVNTDYSEYLGPKWK